MESLAKLLPRSGIRISETSGQLRAGERVEVIPDASVVEIEFDRETFFSDFLVLRERAIGEAVPFHTGVFLQNIDNAARIQRPECKVRNEYGDGLIRFDCCILPKQLNPRHIKHLPELYRTLRAIERDRTLA